MNFVEIPDKYTKSENIDYNGGYYLETVRANSERNPSPASTSLKYSCSAYTLSFSDFAHLSIFSQTGSTSAYWIHALTKLNSYNDYLILNSVFSNTAMQNICVLSIPKIHFGDRTKFGTFEIVLTSGEKYVSITSQKQLNVRNTDYSINFYPYFNDYNEAIVSNNPSFQLLADNIQFKFDVNNIEYYYIDNRNIILYLKDKTSRLFNYSSSEVAKINADRIFNAFYKNIVSFEDNSGYVYNVNANNINSYTGATSSIQFTFSSKNLTVNFDSSTSCSIAKRYIDNVKFGFNFTNSFTGTKYYVDKSGGGDYTSISAGIAGIANNNALVVRAGEYNESITSKNITIFFEKGTTFNGNIICMSGAAFNILGYGKFKTQNSQINQDLFTIHESSTNYIEFNELDYNSRNDYYGNIFNSKSKFSSLPATTFIKGFSINTNGLIFKDILGGKIDIDIVKSKSKNELIKGFSSTSESIYTIRNAKVESSSSYNFSLTGASQIHKFNLINVTASSNLANLFDISSNSVSIKCTTHNSLFYSVNQNNFYSQKSLNLALTSNGIFAISSPSISSNILYIKNGTSSNLGSVNLDYSNQEYFSGESNLKGKLFPYDGFAILYDDSTNYSSTSNLRNFLNSISSVKWQTEILHSEINVFCTIKPFSLNYSQNPSAFKSLNSATSSGFSYGRDSISGMSSEYIESISSSNVFATTISYYNNLDECLIVSKLSRPIKIIKELPYSFRTKIDLNIK